MLSPLPACHYFAIAHREIIALQSFRAYTIDSKVCHAALTLLVLAYTQQHIQRARYLYISIGFAAQIAALLVSRLRCRLGASQQDESKGCLPASLYCISLSGRHMLSVDADAQLDVACLAAACRHDVACSMAHVSC